MTQTNSPNTMEKKESTANDGLCDLAVTSRFVSAHGQGHTQPAAHENGQGSAQQSNGNSSSPAVGVAINLGEANSAPGTNPEVAHAHKADVEAPEMPNVARQSEKVLTWMPSSQGLCMSSAPASAVRKQTQGTSFKNAPKAEEHKEVRLVVVTSHRVAHDRAHFAFDLLGLTCVVSIPDVCNMLLCGLLQCAAAIILTPKQTYDHIVATGEFSLVTLRWRKPGTSGQKLGAFTPSAHAQESGVSRKRSETRLRHMPQHMHGLVRGVRPGPPG